MPIASGATSVAPKALEDIVADSDHVVLARVVAVDMVNAFGMRIEDPDARSGPGSRNRIRFHLEVREVLFTACRREPRNIVVPLWSAWHYRLGQMRDQVTGSDGVFLLKGAGFEPAYPAGFQRSLDERSAIEPLVAALRLHHAESQMDCKEDRTR